MKAYPRIVLDRIVPTEALEGFARVAYRKVDSLDDQVRRGEVLVASGGICAPAGTIISHWGTRGWDDRHGWVSWPSLREMIPAMRAPRGAIAYASLPPQHAHPGRRRAAALLQELTRGR